MAIALEQCVSQSLAEMNISTPLPPEILDIIFCHVTAQRRETLYACTLVSRSWYSSSVALMYHEPYIDGWNFDKFVRAICPSVNAHIRTNGLAELVHKLDMSKLVHNGSKSLTARILGRVKGSLEEFVAPQASFAVNCLAAISKCARLRVLNLSFVSESIVMSDLLRSISHLERLEVLYLPRSSNQGVNEGLSMNHSWPANLQALHISGGLFDESMSSLHGFPPSVSRLAIGHCPHLTIHSIEPMLEIKGQHLQYLEIVAPIPALSFDEEKPLDFVLDLVPNIHHLRISLDFLGLHFFAPYKKTEHGYENLQILDLDCLDPAKCAKITPLNVWNAIADGDFNHLRKLSIHKRLRWSGSVLGKQDLKDIDDLLKAMAADSWPREDSDQNDAGLVFFGRY